MRLLGLNLNGEPYLTTFSEDDAPPYAVLSHTWEMHDQEVIFKDIVENSGRTKFGYRKVEFCGKQARNDGLEYFWLDSCCIDKSSSAELSKAINSMFRWYRNSKKCYVYLTDVSATAGADRNLWESEFRRSRWFTRGWTLQELLAPVAVEFFSEEGQRLGDRQSLEGLIHEVTGVASGALQGKSLSQFSIEEKLSWAEKRQTTEPEDKAYSLLGIFEIFLPLIYGEGKEHALRRLREAIKDTEQSETTIPQKDKAPERTDAIRMTMPLDPTADCTIHIDLGGPTVPNMIRKLTGSELEITNGMYSILLSNGNRLTPSPSFRINGFNDKALDELFPLEGGVTAAIRSSNLYKKESSGEPVFKSCVSFLVRENQDMGVTVELSVGHELGSKLAETLYR